MDENKMRGKGKLEELGGAVKETAGEWTGNEELRAEGQADQVRGEGRQAIAKGIGAVKGAGEELGGAIQEGVGRLTGDDSQRMEGEADQLKGQARQKLNE
jgi:uncharacterized protein YjbJ (UPF0337 family)